MPSTPDSIRERLIEAVEHCYYSGRTAGQMWLHDLSAHLQALPEGDARLHRLAAAHADPLAGVQEHLCEHPQALAQAFDPDAWLDRYTELTA